MGEDRVSPPPWERTKAFEAFLEYIRVRRDEFTGEAMLEWLMRMLGPSLQIHDASAFVFEYARKQGYHIPSYPYDPTSEIRSFLSDYGVENVRGWYARIGVDDAVYDVLGQRRLLVVRDEAYRRKAFVMSLEGRLTDSEACRLVTRAITFLMAGERNDSDPSVF